MPSEFVLTPGNPPHLPKEGSLTEMTWLYYETIDLYAECEDKRQINPWIKEGK